MSVRVDESIRLMLRVHICCACATNAGGHNAAGHYDASQLLTRSPSIHPSTNLLLFNMQRATLGPGTSRTPTTPVRWWASPCARPCVSAKRRLWYSCVVVVAHTIIVFPIAECSTF